jgi:hypothetical protein
LPRARRGARLRGDVEQAALRLIARRGAEIVATARRYAANLDDAYQRGLEILLRKAPSTREEDLVPWLKTVVKHEAFALRRHRERHAPVTDDGEPAERGTQGDATHDQACRYELLRQGAEALRSSSRRRSAPSSSGPRATPTPRSAGSPAGRTRRSIDA